MTVEERLEAVLARRREGRRQPPAPAMRRLLRQRAGLTQQDLAEALGVPRPTLTRWEGGSRTPRGPMLARYAVVLDRLAAEARG